MEYELRLRKGALGEERERGEVWESGYLVKVNARGRDFDISIVEAVHDSKKRLMSLGVESATIQVRTK